MWLPFRTMCSILTFCHTRYVGYIINQSLADTSNASISQLSTYDVNTRLYVYVELWGTRGENKYNLTGEGLEGSEESEEMIGSPTCGRLNEPSRKNGGKTVATCHESIEGNKLSYREGKCEPTSRRDAAAHERCQLDNRRSWLHSRVTNFGQDDL